MKLLLVEDDTGFADLVQKTLTSQKYLVDVATDGQMGMELAELFQYDLILLDLMLPELDGISLCKERRRRGDRTPILLVTAQDGSTEKVAALDAGADDYLVKPFDLSELLARIRALLRRGNDSLSPLLQWGELCLDPSNLEVRYQQELLHLTAKEYSLLELFLRHPQRIFSKNALLDHLWSFEEPPSEGAVRTQIKGLRQKLKKAGIKEDLVETIYGLGYRLNFQEISPTPKEKEKRQEIISSLTALWEEHQPKYLQRLKLLEENLLAGKRQEAIKEAHTLIGSLGSFGLKETAHKCRQLEKMLHSGEEEKLEEILFLVRQEIELANNSPISKAQQVLIMDEDTQVREIISNLLTPWGLKLTFLSNIKKVRDALKQSIPDLLIFDQKMGGIHLCQEVRHDDRTRKLPILLLSPDTKPQTVYCIFAAGADDYVQKPIIAPELIARVVKSLQLK
ncbi:MAG: response regulator [Gomphosphaeria aponina SAG 52.96 = DSM 107014]|uniref:Response regulator n=1 Tax=Gomphosphaeria aponina SAG 52.96 = DSM 107014 TaxID=1521640 RepID=A0A941JL71_9CHRO|nr:response regulator [Gomphosphaeria aponina SAG 52.96 = DSM 107014]